MMRRIVSLALLLAAGMAAQPSQPPLPEPERRQWFRDAKFGMFIHWGVYSVIGRHEWARNRFEIPQAEYDKYARQFNPVNFNADAWVDLAQNAGAKYMVITSKHHDGFSIYRSKVSDYDMEITPYPGDPLKMLADACRRKNMRLGFYHSIMDWHQRNYTPKRAWEVPNPNEGGNLDKYLTYMKAQLKELLTNYGDVSVIWFDGEWEHKKPGELHEDEIYNYIHELQPNTLINDRLYNRRPGNPANYGTPEQFVPATGMRDTSGQPMLWESCVTINNDSWGYNKYETDFKTSRDLIRMLIEVVSKGGNLLLNVGPKPDGTIQVEFVERLNSIGKWMAVNSEAIYGTTASPFARLPFFGRATTKGNTLYLHVFQWPANGQLRVPGLKNLITNAHLMGDAAKLSTRRDGDDMIVTLPPQAPDEVASVVVLQLDGTPQVTPYQLRPDANGTLSAGVESSEIETRFEQRAKKENFLGHVFLTQWTRSDDLPTWTIQVPKAGRYKTAISYSSPRGSVGTDFVVTAGKSELAGKVKNTDGDLVFKQFDLGEMTLAAGEQTLQVKPTAKGGAEAMRLERVVLVPVQ